MLTGDSRFGLIPTLNPDSQFDRANLWPYNKKTYRRTDGTTVRDGDTLRYRQRWSVWQTLVRPVKCGVMRCLLAARVKEAIKPFRLKTAAKFLVACPEQAVQF